MKKITSLFFSLTMEMFRSDDSFKKILQIGLFVIGILGISIDTIAGPLEINLLSSTYKISGSYILDHPSLGSLSDSYDKTNQSPINESVSYSDWGIDIILLQAYSSADLFSIASHTRGYGPSSYSALASASASGEWVFRPLIDGYSDPIPVSFYNRYAEFSGQLKDITSDEIIWSINDNDYPLDWGYYSDILTIFKSDHVYSLLFESESLASFGSGDNPNFSEISTSFIKVSAVPEPSSIILLSAGLLSLSVIRKKIISFKF